MYTEWKPATKYIAGVALLIAGLFLIYISRSIIYLLIGGALISLVLRPLILFFINRLRFPRVLAVFVSYLLGGLIVLLAPLVLVPPVVDAVSILLEIDYQEVLTNILKWIETTLILIRASRLNFLGINLVLDSVVDPILGYLQGVSPDLAPVIPSYELVIDSLASAFSVSYGLAVSLVGGVVSGLVAFSFLIISSIYLSIDGPRFYRGFLKLFPKTQRPEIALLNRRIRNTWDAFFKGQLALMTIIGVTVWLGLTIIGIPGAFALAVLAGLLEIIPSLGPFLATIPAIIVALIQGSSYFDINHWIVALIVLGFYLLVQAFENYVVVPHVLGGAVKLHPLVVMAGVLVGASVWGILGALLAAPIIATGKEIIGYVHRKIMGEEPFPEITSPPIPQIPWVESSKTLIQKGQRFVQDKIPSSTSLEPDTNSENGSTDETESGNETEG